MPTIVERCYRAGFNALIPEVYAKWGAAWDCKIGGVNLMRRGMRGHLPILIRQAHGRGMKVIPYLCITMAPKNTPAHLLIKDMMGEPVQGWGSVFKRSWRERMSAIVRDLVRKFDVDGIMWDYVRARPDFDAQNVAAYREYFNRDYRADTTWNIEADVYPWQVVEWQETHLLTFLVELRAAVREVKPNLPVFAFAPSFWPTNKHRLVGRLQGRNMIKMLNFNLVDGACLPYPSLRGKLASYDYLGRRLTHPERVIGHISNWRRRMPHESGRA